VNNYLNNEMSAALGGRLLLLFDGHCGLCNGAVRWLLKRDRRDRLRFAPLDVFAEIAEQAGETMVAVRAEGKVLTRSDAVLAAMKELPQPWAFAAGVMRVVPRGLRDWVYACVARNRFRFKKRLAVCPMPTEKERWHFIARPSGR
jgi:predicted DCC family thiol-disulfide oxidoreductase YuxK